MAFFMCIYGLGYHFCKEIHYPEMILTIIDTYVTPILEYCSIVWNRNVVDLQKHIENINHKATRLALGTSYRPHQGNYVDFETRLLWLKRNTYTDRRIITSIIFVHKLIHAKENSRLRDLIGSCTIASGHRTRNPNLFEFPRYMHIKSRMHICMSNANKYRDIVDFMESEAGVKKKMKRHLLSNHAD